MIDVQHLTKRYGERTAIEDLTFTVEKGEVLAFLGPNGAGKTTTMRILTGFLPATSGTATISGFDIFEAPMEARRRIGYLPENPPLYNELTVKEYLTFISKIKGIPKSSKPEALHYALDRCALTEVSGRLIGNLSKGFRQRVGLAQALIHNPDVLILDEPTVGLDPKQIIEMRGLIHELAGSHTLILSTHILPEATAICQRVIIIHEGRIRAIDSPEHLSANLRQSEKIRITVRNPHPLILETLKSLNQVTHVFEEPQTQGQAYIVESELGTDVREQVAQCVVNKGWGLLELKSLSMTLEDVFLKLTQEEPSQGEGS
jgi:ABC-2 type transport system ATP-binding protein